MTKRRWMAVALFIGSAIPAGAADAAVTYQFLGVSPPVNFNIQTPDFITAATTVSYANAGAVGGYAYDRVYLCPATTTCGVGSSVVFTAVVDEVYFTNVVYPNLPATTTLPDGTVVPVLAPTGNNFRFAAGTFARNGLSSNLTSNSGTATLLVTDGSFTPSVPEPATWALMLIGFGMVAGASRYRRRSSAITYA